MTPAARVLAALTLGAAAVLPALPGRAHAAPAAPQRAATTTSSYTQPCGGTSWVAGTTDICNGSVVYRDYVDDDEGADLGEEDGLPASQSDGSAGAYGTLAFPSGDVRYPAGDVNTADLVSLTLTRSGDRVDVVATLGALYHPQSTTLAIAVGDADHPAPAKAWGDLGVSSSGWDNLYTFGTGDVAANTISGSFPLPAAAHLRLQAVTAQTATHTVMNVAFRPDEKAGFTIVNATSTAPVTNQGLWFEDEQAAALKAGDISQFGVTVDTADLSPGTTQLTAVDPGLHERVYTSDYSVDTTGTAAEANREGFSYAGVAGRGTGGTAAGFLSQSFNLLGRYQPYGVYIPAGGGPYGMQMEFHGSNNGLAGIINQPGMQHAFGDALHRILVTPEARGPNGFGSDLSERDLLDVMKDVQAAYPIDRTRVFAGGYSQGGYETFRMASLYPDVFAGFTAWVGFTGDDFNGPAAGTVSLTAGAVGNMLLYVGNLRHVPGSMIYASGDELVQVPSTTAMQQAFAKTDDVYSWYLHTPAEHLTFALLDSWDKEAINSGPETLQADPAHVTYSTDPMLDDPAAGIVHDHAYWLSRLRGRAAGMLTTDLTSHGCGVTVPTLATTTGAGTAPVAWTSIAQQQTGTTHLPATQKLEGTLTNVASLTVDAAAACISGALPYSITSDGPGTLTLSDGRSIPLVAGLNTGTLAAPAVAATPSAPVPTRAAATPTKAAATKKPTPRARRTTTTTVVATPVSGSGVVVATQPRRTLAFTGADLAVGLAALVALAGAAVLARRRP